MELVLQQMMLQILKKQNYNSLSFFKKLLILKSLVALVATGLFAVNTGANKYFTNKKGKSVLLKTNRKLNDEEYDLFMLGRSFFAIPWVEAPSATTARDGLGPLFNANTCTSCHPRNGRGVFEKANGRLSRDLVVRLSIPNNGSKEHKKLEKMMGFIPEPTYGSQISINGIHKVPFEAKPKIEYEEIKVKFPDGEIDNILKPRYSLTSLNYGKLAKGTKLTFRLANSLHGLGLIEKISDEQILANADEFDKNNDGISGKPNMVYSNISQKIELGRYTWKASTATIMEQIANAAHNDMGLTTFVHPKDNCTKKQVECNNADKPRDTIDLTDLRLGAINFYLENLRAYKPKEDKEFKEGLEIFKQVSCSACHISNFKVENGINVPVYSDLLLHDMGEGLSDGRSEFKASGSEWRTAPLWGLALHEKINKKKPRLLHDGRARNFQEAILWHNGEAKNSKLAYMSLPKEQRKKLIKFLESL